MTERLAGRHCECGRELPARAKRLCDLCRVADPHRNRARVRRRPSQMFVSVDCEGHQEGSEMVLVSASYGREDGSSESLSAAPGGRLTGQEVIQWLIERLAAPYTDESGRPWVQVPVAFHFGWDTAVIARDFSGPLVLVHKSTAKERGLLCWTEHPPEDVCLKFHRDDQAIAQAIITEGGEGDVLAWDPGSGLALATSHKRRFYAEHRPHGDLFDGNRRLDIHDTGSAFVGGLLRVIDVWQPELSDAQRSAIEWGKAARQHGFLGGSAADIERYSEAECVAHARCCRLLLRAVREATHVTIEPRALFGSGSIAAATFKHHQVTIRDETDHGRAKVAGLTIEDVARMTYFGGLIEADVLGLIDQPVDEVDINSAYPSKAIQLPCMAIGHGKWHRQRGDVIAPPGAVGHVLATWAVDSDTSTPPFVVRTPQGTVRQPLSATRVWVSLPEYEAAVERFPNDVIAVESVWWQPHCGCVNPLGWLSQVYDARQAIKAEMKGLTEGSPEWQALNCRQEAIKLVINSAYGKTAQQRPDYGRYTNLHWASYITGATRAQVRRETWGREAQGGLVVYQHTDSVLSIGGDPQDGGKALGAWGLEHQSHGLVIVQPGLAVSMIHGKVASRGVQADPFRRAVERWLYPWSDLATRTTHEPVDLTQHPMTWTPLTIGREMMISRRMAIARGKPGLAGAFQPMPLTVKFRTGKRDLRAAQPVPGNPQAWAVPPVPLVQAQATLDDLRDFKTELTRRILAGEFDSTPL